MTPNPIRRRKLYHRDTTAEDRRLAREGKLVTDKGEAWRYEASGMDGTGGEYDMVWRRSVDTAYVVTVIVTSIGMLLFLVYTYFSMFGMG